MTSERFWRLLVQVSAGAGVLAVAAIVTCLVFVAWQAALTPSQPDPPPRCTEFAGIVRPEDSYAQCPSGAVETTPLGGNVLVRCRCGTHADAASGTRASNEGGEHE